jgi:hypothetical protein
MVERLLLPMSCVTRVTHIPTPHHTQRLKTYKYNQIKVIRSVCIVKGRCSSDIGDEPMPSRMLRSSDATILSLPSTEFMSSIPAGTP